MGEKILISQLMESSGVKFGTSGARGKVIDLTPLVCYAYTSAFLRHSKSSDQLGSAGRVVFGGDLRPSTPQILRSIEQAVIDAELEPIYVGLIPSPAVALYGMEIDAPSIMVTGSHIPDDRNGVKFNTPSGEITKQDEMGIKSIELDLPDGQFAVTTLSTIQDVARKRYVTRLTEAFGSDALKGLEVGVYEHTSVGRDLFVEILEGLGSSVTRRGRAEKFIPVDTEAIREEDVKFAHDWIDEQKLDAIISSDGDADRPLISDEQGNWLRGDILGILVSQFLAADGIATPISCNTAVEKCGFFKSVTRTKIGSPFVIEGMQALAESGLDSVVGYEANGGYLTYTPVVLPTTGRVLSPLPTRDCMLPILCLLALAKQRNGSISKVVASLPERFTLSDRVKEMPTDVSKALIERLHEDTQFAAMFVRQSGNGIKSTDTTDGFRMTLDNEDVIHIRPSGNAPECRCYVESDRLDKAEELLELGLAQIKAFYNK